VDVHLDSLELFTRSMERCIAAPLFLERFYGHFLGSSPEIAKRFAAVDLKRQTSMVRASLYHILRAAQGSSDGLIHLDEIADSHSQRGHDIQPAHYALWLDSLIEAAKETGPGLDAMTEAAWRFHLGNAIEVMVARYHAR
jgi:hemoglobin-like flavoprotein